MHILSLNAGSATLKFGIFDPDSATPLMEATIDHPAVDAAAFDEIERQAEAMGITDKLGGFEGTYGGTASRQQNVRMATKYVSNVLLAPGESGWEIWTGPSGEPFTLHAATEIERAGDLTQLPSGDLLLLFPVKAITAVPMRVTSDDDALFPDLAALHAELLFVRA